MEVEKNGIIESKEGSSKQKKISEKITICEALSNDIPLILNFVKELANYEHLVHEVAATEEILEKALFGPDAVAEAIIAYYEDNPVGCAVYFHNFSTFLGRPGIYLEDLYVQPDFRGRGIGRSLLSYLAQLAKRKNCGRLEWSVLDWNESAIQFYKNLGAIPLEGWTVFRLAGKKLESLAVDMNCSG